MTAPHDSSRDDARLCDWIDGRLAPRDRERFEAELRVNAKLRAEADEYRRTVDTVRRALQEPGPSIDVADRVLAALRSPSAAPRKARPPLRLLPALLSGLAAAAVVTIAIVLREQEAAAPSTREVADAPGEPSPSAPEAGAVRDDAVDAKQELTAGERSEAKPGGAKGEGGWDKNAVQLEEPHGDARELGAGKAGGGREADRGKLGATVPGREGELQTVQPGEQQFRRDGQTKPSEQAEQSAPLTAQLDDLAQIWANARPETMPVVTLTRRRDGARLRYGEQRPAPEAAKEKAIGRDRDKDRDASPAEAKVEEALLPFLATQFEVAPPAPEQFGFFQRADAPRLLRLDAAQASADARVRDQVTSSRTAAGFTMPVGADLSAVLAPDAFANNIYLVDGPRTEIEGFLRQVGAYAKDQQLELANFDVSAAAVASLGQGANESKRQVAGAAQPGQTQPQAKAKDDFGAARRAAPEPSDAERERARGAAPGAATGSAAGPGSNPAPTPAPPGDPGRYAEQRATRANEERVQVLLVFREVAMPPPPPAALPPQTKSK